MATDIGPIVQRLLQRLVLAGVPLMVTGCGGGGGTPLGGMDAGRGTGGAFGQSGGSSATGGVAGGGGRVGSGGAGGLALGSGGATGGGVGGVSASGGASSGGQRGTATGGAGGSGSGGAAGSGTGSGGTGGGGTGGGGTGGGGTGGGGTGGGGTGGTSVTDGGVDVSEGGQNCAPLTVTCGSPTLSCPGPVLDAGLSTVTLPTTTVTRSFDPGDARWADLYRSCVASGSGGSCGPDCRGLCQAVLGLGDVSVSHGYLKCEIPCGSTVTVTISFPTFGMPVCGRRPAGGVAARCRPANEPALGRLLAEAAELEAASVPAFRRVAADLATHGAPADLIVSARAAVVDEARHWRRTSHLARRRGGVPVRPEIAATAPASLEQLALDNVVEGCVRETFGAMVAAYQAANAADPDVATLMAEIAEDELNHATLAWRIDAWASTKLAPEFQVRRNLAARAALRELIISSGAALRDDSSAEAAADSQASAQAGLPSSDEVKRLMGTAWSALWERGFAVPASAARADCAQS